MDRRKYPQKNTLVLLLLLGVLNHITIINGNVYGFFSRGKIPVDNKNSLPLSNSIEDDEEHCERLPPKYSNSSGSLEYSRLDLLSLLKQGTDLIDQKKYIDKAMLILGNTGSGKTTISQILSGNLDSVHAVLTESDRLVIIDDNYKISGPSTTSKTLIPELVTVEVENGYTNADYTAFYDCPGFDDTRGPEQDLAANFFMNHVVRRKVGQLKMLFLVIHSSVKLGNDRLDFDLLTTHATKFIKNLPKYKNSFGLVVTKVNSYNARGRYIPDKTILHEITEFLNFYNRSLHDKLALSSSQLSPDQRNVIEKKIQFVEILLEKDKDGGTPKITFSRDPEKCGPLSKSTAVAQTRKRIQNMYENELQFAPSNYSDFGYTLKDSTTLSVRRISQTVNREIATSIEKLAAHFENWMETKKYAECSNLEEIIETTDNAQLEFSVLAEKLQQIMNTTLEQKVTVNVVEIAEMLTKAMRKIGYHVSSRFENFMTRQQTYIEFFEADDSSKVGETWLHAITKLRDDYATKKHWLKFCQIAETEVAKYSFQSKKGTDFPRNGTSGWLSLLEVVAGIPVSAQLKAFSRKLDEQDKSYLAEILVNIMKFAMKNSQVQCSHGRVNISGNFVRISEFAQKLNDDRLCGNGNDLKMAEVYASHTIFLDEDIFAVGRELNLVLIAPYWVVVGQRNINLAGYDAQAVLPDKARSGRDTYGENGTSGIPGPPGGPGGSVLGYMVQVNRDKNGDSLRINCDGGDGGQGQDGGDGGSGPDGPATAYGSKSHEVTDLNLLVYKASRTEFDGYSGYSGGDGGLGGFGGLPGVAGKCQLNLIGDVQKSFAGVIQTSEKSGKVGVHGNPGKGGTGGRPGKGMTCKRKRLFFWAWGNCEQREPRTSSGDEGVTYYEDLNTEGIQKARSPTYNIVKWKSLANFMRNFQNDDQQATTEFVDMVNKKPYILGDTADQIRLFLDEFHSLGNSDNASYRKYIDFIKKFERFIQFAQTDARTANVANLLLAAAYSKIASLKQDDMTSFVGLYSTGYLNHINQQLDRYSGSNLTAVMMEIQRFAEMNLQERVERVRDWEKEALLSAVVNAMTDRYQKMEVLERKFTQLVNSTEEEARNWGDIEWQIRRQEDIKEILELGQISQVLPLAVNIINFLTAKDLVGILASPPDKYVTTAVIQEVDTLVALTSAWLAARTNKNASEFVYLDNRTLSSLQEKFANDSGKMARLEELLGQIEILARDAHERRMLTEQSFEPLVKSILSYFSALKTTLNRNTGRLDEHEIRNAAHEWQVQGHVKKIKENLSYLVDGVNDVVYLEAFERIQDGLIWIIDLYDSIEQFQNIRKLTTYLALSRKNKGSGHHNMIVAADELESELGENLLEREYQRAWHAVKMWTFPFAKSYDPKNGHDRKGKEFYKRQVQKWAMELENDIDESDNFLKGDFYDKPFYVWENSKWGSAIRDLLGGRKVHLKADVREASRDAVKCHKIELKFKVKADMEEREFRKQLQEFKVVMTHSGISYYKWGNDFYAMTEKNMTLEYALVEGGETNDMYDLMKKGRILVSPYTLWTMQLKKVGNGTAEGNSTQSSEIEEDEDGISFEVLQRWAKWVDLELVGTGQYVDEDKVQLDLDVGKYYYKEESLHDEVWEFGKVILEENGESNTDNQDDEADDYDGSNPPLV